MLTGALDNPLGDGGCLVRRYVHKTILKTRQLILDVDHVVWRHRQNSFGSLVMVAVRGPPWCLGAVLKLSRIDPGAGRSFGDCR